MHADSVLNSRKVSDDFFKHAIWKLLYRTSSCLFLHPLCLWRCLCDSSSCTPESLLESRQCMGLDLLVIVTHEMFHRGQIEFLASSRCLRPRFFIGCFCQHYLQCSWYLDDWHLSWVVFIIFNLADRYFFESHWCCHWNISLWRQYIQFSFGSALLLDPCV